MTSALFCITMPYMARRTPHTNYLTSSPLRDCNEHTKLIWLWLMDNPDVTVTTRDLGELLGMNPLTVSRAMVTLEQHKLLTRTPTNGKRAKTFSYLAAIPDGSL
jgi:hypothetical protein